VDESSQDVGPKKEMGKRRHTEQSDCEGGKKNRQSIGFKGPGMGAVDGSCKVRTKDSRFQK